MIHNPQIALDRHVLGEVYVGMARALRKPILDGWYHVFSRGWDRRSVFSDDRDRLHFLELLGEYHQRYRIRIHAYALMSNHYHLVVQTPDGNLSDGMRWLNGSYGVWHNTRHQRVGTLWQGRFRDVVVENSAWAYELSQYVHLNPLRLAGLGLDQRGRVLESRGYRQPSTEQVTERLRRLRAYRWSSYRVYGGYASAPNWLTSGGLLKRAHREENQQRSAYRKAIKENLAYGVDPSRVERLRDVVSIGTAEYALKIRKSIGKDIEGHTGVKEMRKRVPMDRVRIGVEKICGERWEEMSGRHGHVGRPLLLWGIQRYCGETLREAGVYAGGMKTTAVNNAIKRLEAKGKRDKQVRDYFARLKKELEG